MKLWRAILGLILLCGLAFLIYQKVKPNPPQPNDPASSVTAKDSHETSPNDSESVDDENLPALASDATVAVPAPTSGPVMADPQAFQESLKTCAPERDSSSLPSLLISLESESEGRKSTEWRTYTLTWGDGSERRVMVTPKDGANTKYAWEVKLFSVDDEGLPVVEELPENVEGPQDLARLLSMGEVRGSSEAYQLALSPGEILMVEKKDGKISEFQWRRGNKSMLCSVERCKCLQ